jgi:hypothetical protein
LKTRFWAKEFAKEERFIPVRGSAYNTVLTLESEVIGPFAKSEIEYNMRSVVPGITRPGGVLAGRALCGIVI